MVNAHGFHRTWMTSCTLKIRSGISDMMLHKLSFISWRNAHWLLFTYNHELDQWKLSFVSLICIYMNSCCFASISTWHNGTVNLIWWRKNIKLRFCDLLYNNFQMNKSVAQSICWNLQITVAWIFSRLSILPAYSIWMQ